MKVKCPRCGEGITIPPKPVWLPAVNETAYAELKKILEGAGKGPNFVKPVVVRRLSSGLPVSSTWTAATGNRFAFGFCTWYVYNRKPVPWLGNANQWFAQAIAYGWRTGQTPAAGAIMVSYESSFGHVAYVENVNPDGSWRVSEMNFTAWDVVDYRTIQPHSIPLAGFIYGP